ncbi:MULTISPECIES: GNAT family N-acetyltransferase [unclassified Nocardioides]|uniref:GNAT family N-acetyltransferase n=1 Tax=unclassified Nocardioides TaxID=2615069 RepID=UPI000702E5F6|nr:MULTISPECIES: GNAT family N-acetyltransferase [unclassified Nocardioides]KRC56608.1 GCN5 family acetyltransferase [Nocardioides sp. Root79]KRC76820.1 GCN5 family acetyltransferase [Nocardioides sp. Root240]
MTGQPTFRAATEDDVDAIVTLVHSAYRGDSSRSGWTTEADLLDGQRTGPDDVLATITAPDSVLVLAESDGALAACCHVQRRGSRCYFGMFAVDPTRQGGGLGKQVMAYAEELARSRWACSVMEMTVIRQRTDLIAFYERRGYVDTDRRTPFPYGDERFGLPRRDDLEFTLLEKAL